MRALATLKVFNKLILLNNLRILSVLKILNILKLKIEQYNIFDKFIFLVLVSLLDINNIKKFIAISIEDN